MQMQMHMQHACYDEIIRPTYQPFGDAAPPLNPSRVLCGMRTDGRQPGRTCTSSQFASSQLRKCTLTQKVLCSTLAPGISLILQSGMVHASRDSMLASATTSAWPVLAAPAGACLHACAADAVQRRKLHAALHCVYGITTGAEHAPLYKAVVDLVHDRPEARGWLESELVGLHPLHLRRGNVTG